MARWLLPSSQTNPSLAADPSAPAVGAALLDQLAAAVVRRGLETPAVFFLELNRPLTFLAGQATHVLAPFLAPLVGIGKMQEVSRLLDDPRSIDRLLERIECLQRDAPAERESPAPE
jgi:hypothetical protein